jgi:hypothetical protein
MFALEGKWFVGNDLPSLQSAELPSSLGTVSYKLASGSLFGPDGPQASDVAQGCVGDCYFLSALGETAARDPEGIREMFINNRDGTYTVRFFNYNGQADYVTVNRELPVDASGNFVFADRYAQGGKTSSSSASNVLWVALAEKAYAQLAQEGWSRSTSFGSGISSTPSDWNQNCYDALNYGNDPTALEQITGVTSGRCQDFKTASGQRIPGTKQQLVSAWKQGDLIVLWSYGSENNVPKDAAGAPLVVAYHVYALTGYDAQTGLFTLTNPYDDGDRKHSGGAGTRTVTLTWQELTDYLQGFAFVTAPQAA